MRRIANFTCTIFSAAAESLSDKQLKVIWGFDNNTLKLNPDDIHARVRYNFTETIW
jgi:hypothetical protein